MAMFTLSLIKKTYLDIALTSHHNFLEYRPCPCAETVFQHECQFKLLHNRIRLSSKLTKMSKMILGLENKKYIKDG